MSLDHSHQHSSDDIMQADNPHTPIDPSGGSVELVVSSSEPPAESVGPRWLWLQPDPAGSRYFATFIRDENNENWLNAGLAAGFTEDDWFRSLAELQADGDIFIQSYDTNQEVTGQIRVAANGVTISAAGDVSAWVAADGLRLLNLPTADPGQPDMLWNDGGTLKVSAG